MEDQVILVDESNHEIGVAGKMAAHRSGSMQRALSVFVFDASGRLLLQKRASIRFKFTALLMEGRGYVRKFDWQALCGNELR